MKTNAARTQENKSQAAANRGSERRSSREPTFLFEDNRPEALKLRKLQKLANNSNASNKTAQLKEFIKSNLSPRPILNKENENSAEANTVAQSKSAEKRGHGFVDNRPTPAADGLPSAPNGIVNKLNVTQSQAPTPVLQKKLQETAITSPQVRHLKTMQTKRNIGQLQPIQCKLPMNEIIRLGKLIDVNYFKLLVGDENYQKIIDTLNTADEVHDLFKNMDKLENIKILRILASSKQSGFGHRIKKKEATRATTELQSFLDTIVTSPPVSAGTSTSTATGPMPSAAVSAPTFTPGLPSPSASSASGGAATVTPTANILTLHKAKAPGALAPQAPIEIVREALGMQPKSSSTTIGQVSYGGGGPYEVHLTLIAAGNVARTDVENEGNGLHITVVKSESGSGNPRYWIGSGKWTGDDETNNDIRAQLSKFRTELQSRINSVFT